MSLTEWRERFNASASEMLDLLDLTRTRSRSLLRSLLESATVSTEISLADPVAAPSSQPLALARVPDHQDPAPIGVFDGTALTGTVRPSDHADVSAILDSGLELQLDLADETLLITTASPEAEVPGQEAGLEH